MHIIALGNFLAEFLDPVSERGRLGTRYCWGGYLWQLRDCAGRELLSGPEYPNPRPPVFDGQGMPEVFRSQDKQTGSLLNRDSRGRGLIPGIGTVVDMVEQEPILGDVCAWVVDASASFFSMSTRQQAFGYGYELERRWTSHKNTLVSATFVRNTGDHNLDVHWFPHPFFPLSDGGCRFQVSAPYRLKENPGYDVLGPHEYRMNPDYPWKKGYFRWFSPFCGDDMSARLQHPVCGTVSMYLDAPVAYLPVWANHCTISLEPHVLNTLAPGDSAQWNLRYVFGSGA